MSMPPKPPLVASFLRSSVAIRLCVASLAVVTFDLFAVRLVIPSNRGDLALFLSVCGAALTLVFCYRTIGLARVAVRELRRTRDQLRFQFKLYALDGLEVREFDDPLEWRRFIETRKPGYDPVIWVSAVGELKVLTELLSCDHGRRGTSAPVIFETMVFDDQGKSLDMVIRYSTYTEALDGHATVAEALRLLELDAVETTRSILSIVRGGSRMTRADTARDDGA
jgi:hypothetical protein